MRSTLRTIWRSVPDPFSELQNLLSEMALLPLGEKVADRPDEGFFVGGNAPRRPPHPGPLPQFFCENAAMRSHATSAKNWGRGGNMALSS